ncbi:MAG: hypothetical protein ABIK97_00505, partial [candidate division WOR-3 bacterium]
KLKSLGLTHLNENFANFPVIILDYYSPDYCHLMAGNDVLTKYKKSIAIFCLIKMREGFAFSAIRVNP